jgi:hypothetical protein
VGCDAVGHGGCRLGRRRDCGGSGEVAPLPWALRAPNLGSWLSS